MDRNNRGKGRGSSGYAGSTSYASRNFNNRSTSGASKYNDWGNSESYSSKDYNDIGGTKRRYESTLDNRRPYDSSPGSYSDRKHEEVPRKHYRSDHNNFNEGRSNHQHHSSLSGRERYESNYTNVSNSHESSQRFVRRDDNHPRRFTGGGGRSFRSAGGSFQRGGYSSSRGRGARGSNNNSQNRPYKNIRRNDSPSRISEDEMSVKDVKTDISVKSLDTDVAQGETKPSEIELENLPRAMRVEDPSIKYEEDELLAIEGPEAVSGDEKNKETGSEGGRVCEKSVQRDTRSSTPKRKVQATSKDFPEHFIRLQCPHCHQRSFTFREYIAHLSNQRHGESLRKISLQHRMSLAKLRTRQRKEQLQIEAQSARPAHSSRMNFCAICKLYHSESRPNHETTELHKIIKNFLMPYCPICRVNFKSRMLYEKHVATLTHIKNKVNMEKTYERRREADKRKADKSFDEDDSNVFDLDNFLTLDAVGSVDGDVDGCPSLEESVVGEDFVKKVEVFFCDVCQRYLSRTEPLEKVLELHCRTRAHHHAVEERNREVEEEEKQAKEENEPKEEVHPKVNDSNDCGQETLKRTASEERLWVEAEKDIGEIDGDEVTADNDEGALEKEEDNNNQDELDNPVEPETSPPNDVSESEDQSKAQTIIKQEHTP